MKNFLLFIILLLNLSIFLTGCIEDDASSSDQANSTDSSQESNTTTEIILEMDPPKESELESSISTELELESSITTELPTTTETNASTSEQEITTTSTTEVASNTESTTSTEASTEIEVPNENTLPDGVLSNYEGKPRVIGTFIQPWYVENWTKSDWEQHYDTLLEAQIDTMILQWSGDTKNGSFKFIGYPTEQCKNMITSTTKINETYVENALAAAEEKNIKVFVGLNLSDEWWSENFLDPTWATREAHLSATMAEELYSLYKTKYPNAFYGFYWSYEFYNNTSGYETIWANMMNPVLDKMAELDSTMPILLSPYISKYITTTPNELEKMWTNFFQITRFREGDIFCSQDSFGASGLSLDYLEQQMIAMKKAVLTKPELQFWVNCENFVGENGDGPAPLPRFIKQLETFSKYADQIISFSYSIHYTSPSYIHTYHKEYINYLNQKGP